MTLTKNDLKDIKSLLTRKGRKQQGRFSAEGIRLLEEAHRFGVTPVLVAHALAGLSDRGLSLLKEFEAKKVPIEGLKSTQLAALGQVEAGQGMIAVFESEFAPVTQLISSGQRKILLCDGISDPGNLGTLIRSALAFGFDAVILTGQSADPYSPKVVRSTAGAIFGVQLAQGDLAELESSLRSSPLLMIGALAAGKADQTTLSAEMLSDGLILAIGSEATGLSPEIEKLCRIKMTIGHQASVESLNAAVAGSILMKQTYDLAQEANR